MEPKRKQVRKRKNNGGRLGSNSRKKQKPSETKIPEKKEVKKLEKQHSLFHEKLENTPETTLRLSIIPQLKSPILTNTTSFSIKSKISTLTNVPPIEIDLYSLPECKMKPDQSYPNHEYFIARNLFRWAVAISTEPNEPTFDGLPSFVLVEPKLIQTISSIALIILENDKNNSNFIDIPMRNFTEHIVRSALFVAERFCTPLLRSDLKETPIVTPQQGILASFYSFSDWIKICELGHEYFPECTQFQTQIIPLLESYYENENFTFKMALDLYFSNVYPSIQNSVKKIFHVRFKMDLFNTFKKELTLTPRQAQFFHLCYPLQEDQWDADYAVLINLHKSQDAWHIVLKTKCDMILPSEKTLRQFLKETYQAYETCKDKQISRIARLDSIELKRWKKIVNLFRGQTALPIFTSEIPDCLWKFLIQV